jgi:hypothetical protein
VKTIPLRLRTTALTITAFVFCLVVLPGCWHQGNVLPVERDLVIIPEVFYEQDQTWTCAAELKLSDQQQLVQYFTRHPSVAEQSLIRGDPLLYTSPEGVRRYYWVRPGRDGSEWLYLEFDRRSVQMKDGHGLPFLGGAPQNT